MYLHLKNWWMWLNQIGFIFQSVIQEKRIKILSFLWKLPSDYIGAKKDMSEVT